MPYTPILATLGYVLSPDSKRVLMIHRNARPGQDEHHGKYNGLGGKLEPDEDVVAGMKRELLEEAGLVPTRLTLRGTISWPGFGQGGQDWFGFLFVITAFEGQPPASNPEGTLHWVPLEDLLAGRIPLWPGDKFFLPLLFDNDPAPFHGVMPYHNGQPLSWTYARA